ncbi:hypothetical protein [Hyphomicrobium sp.]|uniref:DUF6881 domain-containing protein n=1 Tax=Hyphomicrobium sp. TaxID=82 RepID=UPI000FBEC7EB|nr:MAG: hypothetical protein EKK38_01340 [Hyphomicrobium sp.]
MSEHTYIRVLWLHGAPSDPVDLWSELDRNRFETRKLEIFRDGTIGYACATETAGGSRLGTVPVPSLAEIAADKQFQLVVISRSAFEHRWNTRNSNASSSR